MEVEEDEMLFADAVYVGISPSAGVRPMHYAAMDADLHILALDHGDLEHVLAFVAGHEKAIVAVNAPQAPNRRLMMDPEIRRKYNLRPGRETWGKWRVCEFELRRSNIRLYNTPDTEGAARRWMQNGFKLFRRLADIGYRKFVLEDDLAPHTVLEVQPHAAFTALLGVRPFLKRTLEGRMQRQLVLYLEGIDVPNPLHALEEITQHHLLSGHLPLADLYEQEQLDALVAAYTAHLVGDDPERIIQIGDAGEGLITLPVEEIKDFYH
jgi:predicted nuclease with RNAse H fold